MNNDEWTLINELRTYRSLIDSFSGKALKKEIGEGKYSEGNVKRAAFNAERRISDASFRYQLSAIKN